MKSFEIMKVLYLKFGKKGTLVVKKKDSYFYFKQRNNRRDFITQKIIITQAPLFVIQVPAELPLVNWSGFFLQVFGVPKTHRKGSEGITEKK